MPASSPVLIETFLNGVSADDNSKSALREIRSVLVKLALALFNLTGRNSKAAPLL